MHRKVGTEVVLFPVQAQIFEVLSRLGRTAGFGLNLNFEQNHKIPIYFKTNASSLDMETNH